MQDTSRRLNPCLADLFKRREDTMFEVNTLCFVLVFIGCINAQFTQKTWEVARSERIKLLSCEVDGSTSLSSNAIHWYRAKRGEGLRRILYFAAGSTTSKNEADFSKGFSGSIRGQKVSLTISKVKREDEATYFCALWKGEEKVFSSGTRLYVAESNQIKEPKVSAYLTTKQDNEKNILLCQARNMFPDMVKITWEAEDQNKNTVKVPGTDDELLEQRDEGQEVSVTSMLIINHQKAKYSKFNCIVQHDSSVNKDQRFTIERGEEKPDVTPVPGLVQTCPPPKVKQEGEGEDQQGGDDQVEGEGPDEKLNWGSPGLSRSLYLFRLTYVVLLVKNVLYFCSVSVLLYKRRAWNKEIHMSKT